jgi:transcriptional regulator with XRE-family HTH domain
MTTQSLRSWRLSQGFTRAEAALLFGISVRTLEGIEQERFARSPLLGPIARIVALRDLLAASRATKGTGK